MHLLWRGLHLLHFLDYFHFLKFFHFLYLLLHYLPYQIRVIHRHSAVPLDKDLQPGHIQQVRKLVFVGENVLRTIMVLNKTSMVLIHSANGSWRLLLVVSLHLNVRRGRLFLAWTDYSSSSLPISLDGWHFTPPNSFSNMDRREKPRGGLLNGLGLLS